MVTVSGNSNPTNPTYPTNRTNPILTLLLSTGWINGQELVWQHRTSWWFDLLTGRFSGKQQEHKQYCQTPEYQWEKWLAHCNARPVTIGVRHVTGRMINAATAEQKRLAMYERSYDSCRTYAGRIRHRYHTICYSWNQWQNVNKCMG